MSWLGVCITSTVVLAGIVGYLLAKEKYRESSGIASIATLLLLTIMVIPLLIVGGYHLDREGRPLPFSELETGVNYEAFPIETTIIGIRKAGSLGEDPRMYVTSGELPRRFSIYFVDGDDTPHIHSLDPPVEEAEAPEPDPTE
jgi:hypothetical protein